MNNFPKIAEKLYGIIKGHGHKVRLYDQGGKDIADPTQAVYFFVADPNFMVQLDQKTNSIRLHKSSEIDINDIIDMQKQIRQIAQNNIMNFEFKEFGKEIVPKDYSYEAKRTEKTMESALLEGFSRLSGSTKTSYQTLESVRLVFNHRLPVNEESRGSRSRNISSIFIEHNGERTRFPMVDLAGARAMARHMSKGGSSHDVIGEHIVSICEKRKQLREFLRYATTNKLINEDTTDIISVVYENIFSIRSDLKKFAGAKTYESVCARIEESQSDILAEDDLGELKDMFTVKRFDEKFEDVLPIVKSLVNEKDAYNRRIEESSVNPVYLDKSTAFNESLISFNDPQKAQANKLSMVAMSIQENDELSSYMMKVSNKLAEGSELSVFEHTIVKNVLTNSVIQEEVEEDDEELEEGYFVMPDMDRERYTPIQGLEGPFRLRSGKVVYYDPSEGKYYDRDTDMYLSDEEYFQHAEPGKLKESEETKAKKKYVTKPANTSKNYTRKGGNGEQYKWQLELRNGKKKTVWAVSKAKAGEHLTPDENIIGIRHAKRVEDNSLSESQLFEKSFEQYDPENIFVTEYKNPPSDQGGVGIHPINQAYWNTVVSGVPGAKVTYYEENAFSREIEITLGNDIPITINQEWVKSKLDRDPITHMSVGYGAEKNLGQVKMYSDPKHLSKWFAQIVSGYTE